jgi:transcriptional regulator CtsR
MDVVLEEEVMDVALEEGVIDMVLEKGVMAMEVTGEKVVREKLLKHVISAVPLWPEPMALYPR